MKKIKYLFFIFLLLQINTFSQKSYLKFMTTVQGKWLQNTYDLNEALKWENYYSFNISKPDGFSTKWYPLEQINGQTVRQTGILLENEMNIEFDEAAAEWCKGTDNLLNIHTNVSQENGAELYFSTDVRYFPDPINNAARTIFCSDGQYFVVSTDKQVIYDPYLNEWNKKAKIVYNNTTQLNWVWSTATSGLESIEIPFESISMHELGHLLGLNHEGTNTKSIMAGKFTAGTFPTITSYDWDWFDLTPAKYTLS